MCPLPLFYIFLIIQPAACALSMFVPCLLCNRFFCQCVQAKQGMGAVQITDATPINVYIFERNTAGQIVRLGLLKPPEAEHVLHEYKRMMNGRGVTPGVFANNLKKVPMATGYIHKCIPCMCSSLTLRLFWKQSTSQPISTFCGQMDKSRHEMLFGS